MVGLDQGSYQRSEADHQEFGSELYSFHETQSLQENILVYQSVHVSMGIQDG